MRKTENPRGYKRPCAGFSNGTWRGGRTLTILLSVDFESTASADSAIQA